MPACVGSNMASCSNYYNGGEFNGKRYNPNTSDPVGAYLASAVVPGDLNITAAEACGWTSSCVNGQPNRYSAGPGYNPAPGSLTRCEEQCQAVVTFAILALTTLALPTLALPEVGVPADIAEASIAGEAAASGAKEAAAGDGEVPTIKPGSESGETAGKAFPKSVKNRALTENPNTCVYCRMGMNKPQIDHVIPKSRGGNATPENAQTTCPWCNGSKGARDFPINPPPGYRGAWPPEWWGLP